MDSRCEHQQPKVLKCSGIPLCKKCVSDYRNRESEHVLASLDYAPHPKTDKYLGGCIEKEQKSTSEILEYLEQLQEKLCVAVVKKISEIKAKIVKKSCLQNQYIQFVKRVWDNDNEEGEREVAKIKTYGSANKLNINERVLEEALDTFCTIDGQSYPEYVGPEYAGQDVIVDFLDNHTMRRLDLTKNPVTSTYHEISDGFTLFPESRYCFVDNNSIVCTGGVESGSPLYNSYLVTLPENSIEVTGKMLQYLICPRSKHGICPLSFKPDCRSVFLFGGGVNQLSAEKLDLSLDFLVKVGTKESPGTDDASMEWTECKQMPHPLETAACVSHYEKIYITGSHRTEVLRMMQYDPQTDVYEVFDLMNDLMRYPCVLSCWHTLITIIYSDGEGHWMYDWPIGSMVASNAAKKELTVKTENHVWAPVCPPITIDSKCYILVETETSTVLACYSFIKKQVTFPEISTG